MPSESSQLPGHPKLIQKIVEEIAVHGPITFARFMELALYDEDYGYYMTNRVDEHEALKERIGWDGDFYTAPEFSPILAKTLVRQVLEIDDQLGHPDPFTFVEMGGGNGTFAADFLHHCQETAPGVCNRLRYLLVERSPNLRLRQEYKIQKVMSRAWMDTHLTWKPCVTECAKESVIGVMFSNELVDAFPVHRVRGDSPDHQEILVDYEKGQFVERTRPLSSTPLKDYVDRHRVVLNEGQTSELHVVSERWMRHVAQIMGQGFVITIDYGYTRNDYYAANRYEGTLLCYYRHAVSRDPFSHVGAQDMTAHVNFSVLADVGKEHGLELRGFTTLANWLMGLGVEEMVVDLGAESKEVQALSHLLRPHGMGTTFKVLVQRKGIEEGPLQGLRYRAFFDDALC